MLRKIENANNNKIRQLLKNINLGISSMLSDYDSLYTKDEKDLLYKVSKLITKEINNVDADFIDYDKLSEVLECEIYLKPLVFRCWQLENTNGTEFISWCKYAKHHGFGDVISTTFGGTDTFCDSRFGISFDVSIDGFLGACNKDAATVIENEGKESIYTIGRTADGKVINSYNLATPIITPKQVADNSDNTYMSKHNEIILNSEFVRPKCVIYMDDDDLDIVKDISLKYNIPIENVKNNFTR